MSYVAEQVPMGIDPVLAEYLMRQMVAIQNSVSAPADSICETVEEIPTEIIPGKIVNVNLVDGDRSYNGLWACVTNNSGVYSWRRFPPDSRTQ